MVNLYDCTVPVFTRALTNLSAILKKGEEYAKEKGIAEQKVVSETKLVEDMAGLAFQVQRASDSAKGVTARLAQIESPSFPDNEKTFAELQERIQKTLDFLKSVDPSKINGRENEEVTLKFGPKEMKSTAEAHAIEMGIPNFFFHITTAYALLRHIGVPIGKGDYLGRTS